MSHEPKAPETKGVTVKLLATVDVEMESRRSMGRAWAGPRIGTPCTGSRTEERFRGGDLGRYRPAGLRVNTMANIH